MMRSRSLPFPELMPALSAWGTPHGCIPRPSRRACSRQASSCSPRPADAWCIAARAATRRAMNQLTYATCREAEIRGLFDTSGLCLEIGPS